MADRLAEALLEIHEPVLTRHSELSAGGSDTDQS
jgi:hypothetical protein